MLTAIKTSLYTLTGENGDLYQIPDDGRPVGSVYMIDENGDAHYVAPQAGALGDRFRDWNEERLLKKSDKLNERAADGGKFASLRAQRVDGKIERKGIEREEDSKPLTDNDEVKVGTRKAWQENFDRTNPSSSAAETYSIVKLLEVEDFTARIVDNGSSTGTRILRVWSGSELLQPFGDSGTVISMFAPANQLTVNTAMLKFRAGRNIKIDVSIPASGVVGISLIGTARIDHARCY